MFCFVYRRRRIFLLYLKGVFSTKRAAAAKKKYFLARLVNCAHISLLSLVLVMLIFTPPHLARHRFKISTTAKTQRNAAVVTRARATLIAKVWRIAFFFFMARRHSIDCFSSSRVRLLYQLVCNKHEKGEKKQKMLKLRLHTNAPACAGPRLDGDDGGGDGGGGGRRLVLINFFFNELFVARERR